MAGFGGAVKLTGESEYRKAIQQITQELSSMSSALVKQASDFNANSRSMQSTAQQQNQLNDALEAQQAALASAKNAYAQYSVTLQTQQQRHNALSKEYNKAVQELDAIGRASGTTSAEYQKQEAVVAQLADELAESNASMNESKMAMSKLKTEIGNASKVIDKTTQQISELGTETEDSGEKAEEASDGFTIFKGILANLGTQAINTCINGLKKLGGALIDVGKQAINNYARFEQLEGGVKKIFGDEMSKEVIKNANVAFKTAGMSANEYLDTVTSFSATLLQGLGENTNKAASYADMAIRNMSDNANTFGTDIGSIQNAYQGFAKQNYTMLDNLKLGYGGTASEMARLINESGVLGAEMEVTAQTVKDVPFYQMIEAIDKTQERMGIMGTTAKEAAGTIEGSTGSMKAAWENLLTGIADSNSDFQQLVDDFMGTLITPDGTGGMIGSLLPRISTVISGIASMLNALIPALIQSVVPLISENLPVVVDAIMSGLSSIVSALPQLVSAISGLIPQICQSIISMIPELVGVGIEVILALLNGITEAIPQVLAIIPDLIKGIVSVILSNLGEIINCATALILALIQGLSEAIPMLIDYIPILIENIVTAIIDNLPLLVESAVQIIVALCHGILQALPKIIILVPKIIYTIVTTLINNLPQIIQGGVQIIASLVSGMLQKMGDVLKASKEFGTTILSAIKELPSKVVEIGSNLVRGIWNGISSSLGWIKSKLSGWVGDVTSFLKNLFGIASPSKLFRDEIGKNLALGIGVGFTEEMKQVSASMSNAIPTDFDVQASVNRTNDASDLATYYSYDRMVDAFKEALSEMKIELDDEVAGRFVENTITRIVYA